MSVEGSMERSVLRQAKALILKVMKMRNHLEDGMPASELGFGTWQLNAFYEEEVRALKLPW